MSKCGSRKRSRGGGYLWATESESASTLKNMTDSARKRASAKRQQNASARKKRWAFAKKAAALAAIGAVGYAAYKYNAPAEANMGMHQGYTGDNGKVGNVAVLPKNMPESYTVNYPDQKSFLSRLYSGDEGYERVKELTGKYEDAKIEGDTVVYKKTNKTGHATLHVNTAANRIKLTWTPSSYWLGRVVRGNPRTDLFRDTLASSVDLRDAFKRAFHFVGDHSTLENNFMLGFQPHYLHGRSLVQDRISFSRRKSPSTRKSFVEI